MADGQAGGLTCTKRLGGISDGRVERRASGQADGGPRNKMAC